MRMRIGVAALAIAAALAGSTGAVHAQARAQGEAQCGRTGIYVFSAHWCSSCRDVQAFLAGHRVPFQRIEVSGNREAIRYMQANYGSSIVPVVVVDDDYTVGYDEAWMAAKLCFGRPGDARHRAQTASPAPARAAPANPGPAPGAASIGPAMEPIRAR